MLHDENVRKPGPWRSHSLHYSNLKLVPSPRYLKTMLDLDGYELSAIKKTTLVGSNWYKFIEFYSEELSDYYYQFDSVEELKSLVAQAVIDTKNVKKSGPELWEKVRARSLEQWKEVFKNAEL